MLDSITSYASPGGKTLVYNDDSSHLCAGDAGGPALENGKVVGVASTGNLVNNSNYDATAVAFSWLSGNACPYFDKTYQDQAFCDDPMCKCETAEGDCDSDAQCVSGSTCTSDTGPASGMSSTDDLCWRNSDVVTVYANNFYGGPAYKVPAGTWDIDWISANIGNDNIASASVPDGYWLTTYSESGCWGTAGDFEGNNFNMSYMDNQTSCLKVSPSATIYGGEFYGGAGKRTLWHGAVDAWAFGSVGDNSAESIKVAPGVFVTLCDGAGLTGLCFDFHGSSTTLGPLKNAVSSAETTLGATVYQNSDYSGTQQAFKPGTHGARSLSIVGNDQISSIIVAPGYKATLCSEEGDWGTCREFRGWNAFVGLDLNDRTSSIVVAPI